MQRSSLALNIVRVIVLALLAALFLYLFNGEASGDLLSDVPAHIKSALSQEESSYSLLYPFIAWSYTAAGPTGVAVLLTVLEIAAIVVSERLMKALMPQARPEAVFVLALIVNFTIAIYLPFLHPHYTSGLSTGNSWHNSTYLAMKLAGLGAVWSYLRFVGRLESKNHTIDWLLFTFCVVVSAAVKPSFVVAFGPTVVILCVIDLLEEGKGTMRRSLALGVSFVVVLGILAYQYTVLYVEDTSSGIGFGFAKVWRHNHFFFPLGMLQSYAFALVVFVFCWKYQKGDRNYRMALIMFAIALAIYLFVNETGARKYHGNFGWSLKFGVYYLFISSVVAYCNSRGRRIALITPPEYRVGSSPGAGEDGGRLASEAISPKGLWVDALIALVLLWHLLSGIGNIINILSGNGYG